MSDFKNTFIPIWKPKDIYSNDIVKVVRKKYNVKLIVLNDGGKLKHKINKDVEVHNLDRLRLRYSLFRCRINENC